MVPYVNASILALMDENEFDFRPQNGIFFSGIHNLLTLDKIFYENHFVGKDHSSVHSNSQFEASSTFQLLSSRSLQKGVKSFFPTFASSSRRKSWV